MRCLLDTCVISELVSKTPERRVLEWIDSEHPENMYLSVITVGEIRKGVEKLADSKRRQSIHRWLEEDLLIRFDGRIMVFDAAILLEWGKMTGSLEKSGKKMSAMDSLIAASALHLGLTLVTRNESDFKYAKIDVFNPWNA